MTVGTETEGAGCEPEMFANQKLLGREKRPVSEGLQSRFGDDHRKIIELLSGLEIFSSERAAGQQDSASSVIPLATQEFADWKDTFWFEGDSSFIFLPTTRNIRLGGCSAEALYPDCLYLTVKYESGFLKIWDTSLLEDYILISLKAKS
ncbi:hypothetical protein TNCV_1256801 [Trichonephila clavipes]|nr:hypothetical protein TNCV_1256801 [Trichonephila clavipes]